MCIEKNELLSLALENGFTASAMMDVSKVKLLDEVRAMCSEGKCKVYGNNWTCPPQCGDLDTCRDRISHYSVGIIVQTTGHLEDSLDYETMRDTGKAHKENFARFMEIIRSKYPNALGLSAGGCSVCRKCSYPEPCRFPEKAFSSMEGYGMLVSDVCRDNNIPYHYGKNTITYVGCFLLY